MLTCLLRREGVVFASRASAGKQQKQALADNKQKVNLVKAQRAIPRTASTDAEVVVKSGLEPGPQPPHNQSIKGPTPGPKSHRKQLTWHCWYWTLGTTTCLLLLWPLQAG